MYNFDGQTVHFKRSGCSTENGQGVFSWRYIQQVDIFCYEMDMEKFQATEQVITEGDLT